MSKLPINTGARLSENLSTLLEARSKHSTYQEIHPDLMMLLDSNNSPLGKRETARWECMTKQFDWEALRVLDIGANTGYFSIAAIKADANIVVAIEGNQEHAKFIQLASELMSFQDRITVENRYFNFEERSDAFDVALCLNVLHHLGDDFGDPLLGIDEAKLKMKRNLQHLSQYARYCWFQLGFNWKGDRDLPLFGNGLKSELIDFVQEACGGYWKIKDVSIYNPHTRSYEPRNESLMERYNDIGEFLNRPLFLLEKFS